MQLKVDLSELKQQIESVNGDIDLIQNNIVKRIMSSISENIHVLVKQELTRSRKQFLQGLEIKSKDNIGTVELTTGLSEKINDGSDMFDMKDYFRNSSKKKIGKGGNWYLTIPLRFATPNSKGIIGTKMPRSVYEAIKQAHVLKKNNIPSKYKEPTQGKLYLHKHSIYEGMTKSKLPSGVSAYNTFRRVSANSDPLSWIHPGFKAGNFIDRAVEMINIDEIVTDVLNEYL